MNRQQINKKIHARCLLTEVSPFETPLLFSNWGSFHYFRTLKQKSPPAVWRLIFEGAKPTVPHRFSIRKDLVDFRTLHLLHPSASQRVIDLYRGFDTMIVRACQKSRFSIRAPHSIAGCFLVGEADTIRTDYVEQMDESQVYASSYFSYKDFSHLHKFFESEMFSKLERSFRHLQRLDVAKCFPSIYTHSISWAIRGKHYAKDVATERRNDRSLGGAFDRLMQVVNHNETNGIVIGPEMSRVFAEIIFQDIDAKVERRMLKSEYKLGRDYYCVRYMDDMFLFFNRTQIADEFVLFAKAECEQYKLYFNPGKGSVDTRPFITDISIAKIQLSLYVNDLARRLGELKDGKRLSSAGELNAIRAIVSSAREHMHALSNFFLKALSNKLQMAREFDNEKAVMIVSVYVDLAFHWLRMDTRVSTVYKITQFILDVRCISQGFPTYDRTHMRDKLFSEISSALESSIASGACIEALNLLIAAAQFEKSYAISPRLIQAMIDAARLERPEDRIPTKRLSYFEIVTLLYCISSRRIYAQQRRMIMEDVHHILEHCCFTRYSESAHLLLDCLACPFIEEDAKCKILKTAVRDLDRRFDKNTVVHAVRRTAKHSWFFNWNTGRGLEEVLRKKEYMLAY